MEKFKSWALWFFKSFIWLGLLLLIIDIVTKNVVVNNMNVGDTVPLIEGFLHIGSPCIVSVTIPVSIHSLIAVAEILADTIRHIR